MGSEMCIRDRFAKGLIGAEDAFIAAEMAPRPDLPVGRPEAMRSYAKLSDDVGGIHKLLRKPGQTCMVKVIGRD